VAQGGGPEFKPQCRKKKKEKTQKLKEEIVEKYLCCLETAKNFLPKTPKPLS
jgi:hypothetical protein